MVLLTKGWLAPSKWAAAVNPPASTTALNTRISSNRSSFIIVLCIAPQLNRKLKSHRTTGAVFHAGSFFLESEG
jgi:hypothetical protein